MIHSNTFNILEQRSLKRGLKIEKNAYHLEGASYNTIKIIPIEYPNLTNYYTIGHYVVF